MIASKLGYEWWLTFGSGHERSTWRFRPSLKRCPPCLQRLHVGADCNADRQSAHQPRGPCDRLGTIARPFVDATPSVSEMWSRGVRGLWGHLFGCPRVGKRSRGLLMTERALHIYGARLLNKCTSSLQNIDSSLHFSEIVFLLAHRRPECAEEMC